MQRQTLLSVNSIIIGISLLAAAIPVPALAAPIPNSQPSDLIVSFRGDTVGKDVFEQLSGLGVAPQRITVLRKDMLLLELSPDTPADPIIENLLARRDVSAVSPNGTVRALGGLPNDPAYLGSPWGQRDYLGPATESTHSVRLEPLWDAAISEGPYTFAPDRTGVAIAVIDSGVSPDIFEDNSRYQPVWDYVNEDADTADDAAILGYHGTRVASIIAGTSDNSRAMAGALRTLDTRILVYKTLDYRGIGTTADLLAAMRDAADRGVRIVNISAGEPFLASKYDSYTAAVDYCSSRGALVVAAAGNNRGGPLYLPAAIPGALAVGSVDVDSGEVSTFSSQGGQLDLVAFGAIRSGESPIGVWSTPPSGVADTAASGTSFSAPLASGSLAFLWSLIPELPATRLAEIATSTAQSHYGSAPGFDTQTGWGLLDVYAAYAEMTRTVPAQTAVSVGVASQEGPDVMLEWTPAQGAGVYYEYGPEAGPLYRTTATSGRLVLPGDGQHPLIVRSYASDRWSAVQPGEATVTVTGGYRQVTSQRLAGTDRYATAAKVSRSTYSAASSVVIALGSNWPDALSSSGLAGATGGPILLTRTDSLPFSTRDELLRLSPSTIYVVGGTAAIKQEVVGRISTLLPSAKIVRLAGADRYDTAATVAREVMRLTGSSETTAIVTSGESHPDALSGGPVAAAAKWPVLLVKQNSIPGPTAMALAELNVQHAVVLGGTAAVSTSIENELPAPDRWAGSDRYSTSRMIADRARDLGILNGSATGFARGQTYPDALSASAPCAAAKAPVILVRTLDPVFEGWLRTAGSDEVVIFGGASAVPYSLEWDVLSALHGL